MLGYVNGLAVVILLAQFGSFKNIHIRVSWPRSPAPAWASLALVALTMAIIAFLPRLTPCDPSSLAAIITISIIAIIINNTASTTSADAPSDSAQPRPFLTVGDMLVDRTLAAAVDAARRPRTPRPSPTSPQLSPRHRHAPQPTAPSHRSPPRNTGGHRFGRHRIRRHRRQAPRPTWLDYAVPPMTLQTLWIILPFSLILAGVGLIESLMTMTLIDRLTETAATARECIGQGAANITAGSSAYGRLRP
ncbi:MAG: hypothetical protein R3B67_00375 [Phycisphaerales bacterium]